MRRRKLAIGDSITFRAATRSHDRRATRKVVGIDHEGRPLVRYHGWSKFIVHWREVEAIEPA